MIGFETQLYPPLKALFETKGYKVAAEVKGCDMVATRLDEVVVIELKRVFNLELVFQAIQRQVLTQSVYAAIEAPKKMYGRRWRNILKLCRLLGVGLLTVRFSKNPRIQIALDPAPYRPRLNGRSRRLLIHEVLERSVDLNIGGSVRRPLMTAYREKALRIAWHLKAQGRLRPRDLAEAAQTQKAGSILLRNVYGWFERVERGSYQLTPQGVAALERYAPQLQLLLAEWQSEQTETIEIKK